MKVDVAIVGSGFAGSILGRVLTATGRRVAVLEKGRHPRFALGESSTPLAAASLERLSRRFRLTDLHDLAAYGRWTKKLPGLRRGLKRGFTFYHHPGDGAEYVPSTENRLLVAASPSDAVADAHWLRADVDEHLVERARSEGVAVLEGVRVTGVRRERDRFLLAAAGESGPFEIEADRLVDATGPAGIVARALGARFVAPDLPPRGLAFAHLARVPELTSLLPALSPGPYPDERAAVHHLFPGGWLYRLPFDHGVSSCGLLLRKDDWDSGPDPADDPEAAVLAQLRRRAPVVARQIANAEPLVTWRWVPEVAHRLDRVAGPGWLALPHVVAFADPLFSTGIAWSLRAVERIADLFHGSRSIEEYSAMVAREAERIERLVRLAWRTLDDPARFRGVALLYFAAVSFQESRERLLDLPPESFAWDGFLGVGDPVVDGWFREAEDRLAVDSDGFPEWVLRAIEPRDVAGLTDRDKGGLYGVDFEDLVRGASKLGLDEPTARSRVDRLRREAASPVDR